MRHLLIALICVIPVIVLSGCGGTKITRVAPNQQNDLSGNWNAIDSLNTAKEMIPDVMSRPWIDNFIKANGRNPRVQVDQITVRTDGDVIETEIFTNDLVREFINSTRVDAFSNLEYRRRQNEVLKALDANTSEESRKTPSPRPAQTFS